MARSGAMLTYADLETGSNRLAHFFRGLGLHIGDTIAMMMDNRAEIFELAWAAQRSGLIFTCISTRATVEEATYILEDCDARALFLSYALAQSAAALAERTPGIGHFSVGGALPGYAAIEDVVSNLPTTPIGDEACGVDMLYSSGTTGRPKGIRNALPAGPLTQENQVVRRGSALYGMDSDTVYLSPAPLYHAAPLRWSMAVQRLGGTVIAMERFDAEEALALIECHRVTHAQWVPTHFVRMLRLPPEVRARYDMSSLRAVFHSAAPCPIRIKQQMLEWRGPIVHEYYSTTESIGSTAITSEEWLDRPGSVGRPFECEIRILDDEGNSLPPRSEGMIYMRCGARFSYHKDPARTAEAYHDDGFASVGDIGWLDEEGYFYLTDRKSYMII